MATYRTPGVYIEEISKLPPSVAPVATAVPAFLGYTVGEKGPDGTELKGVPKRVTSLMEFEQLFGTVEAQEFKLEIEQTKLESSDAFTETRVSFEKPEDRPEVPRSLLYYSLQLYFANGGGPAWVVSLGKRGSAVDPKDFETALKALEARDEPTLLVFPDACHAKDDESHGKIVNEALKQCTELQDRFTIADVREARPGKTDKPESVDAGFRKHVGVDADARKYGAAYFPYLITQLPWVTEDKKVTVTKHTIKTKKADGSESSAAGPAKGKTLDGLRDSETALHAEVSRFVGDQSVTLPPSGAIAGVYARVDRTRGVWKAPANVGLLGVRAPAVAITNDLNDQLNVHPTTGKSVNAIRAFTGRGTLVWGARTLQGNDNENRYVSVRRFLIFAEQSIKHAIDPFVFEVNAKGTWVMVRTMIENFLTVQWRDGALVGAKPEDAFYVAVGLNETMSAEDILEGLMIVEVGLAIVRPAEFIILRFVQKMQES